MKVLVLVKEADYEEFIGGLDQAFKVKSITPKTQNGVRYQDQYELELEKKEIKKSTGRKLKFTNTDIEEMKTMKKAGTSLREIARKMNASPSTITNYLEPEKRKRRHH